MQPLTVAQLDFLPANYRQQSVRRRDRRWRAALLVGGVVLLAAAWIYRAFDHRAARRNFEMLAAAHETAVDTQRTWEESRRNLDLANHEAALVTYIKHPFTTSQTLSAIVAPMSESLRLTEIKIVREALQRDDGASAPRGNLSDAPDVAESRLPAAQLDLSRLREEYDNQQVVVEISGDALDGEALHQYIRELAGNDIFVRAELTSLERESTTPNDRGVRSHFQARAVMRPGIGQPGGPVAAEAKSRLADASPRQSWAGGEVAERETSKR